MRSLYDFIVKPLGDKYDNEIKLGDVTLILNTKIENFKAVHNVFRVFYDIRGNKKKSRSYFNDDLYFCSADQIYLYKNTGDWKSFGDRCFVMPLKNKDTLRSQKEQELIGILKIGNSSLKALNINPGDTIGFTPGSEWDFIIDDQRVYCMKSNDIVIKYEHKGNEEEYNPSWACSS